MGAEWGLCPDCARVVILARRIGKERVCCGCYGSWRAALSMQPLADQARILAGLSK